MGMSLSGKGGYFSWTHIEWANILGIAYENGWKPMGTRGFNLYSGSSIPDEEWSGTYFSNDHQRVTAEDASNIADALESFLRTLSPDESQDDLYSFNSLVVEGNPKIFFGEYLKTKIEKFIDFCRAGCFRVS